MEKIKIGYFADGPWSHRAFEKLIQDDRIEIAFITPRYDTKDERLREYSDEYNIDYLLAKNVNSVDFINKVKAYDCDLFVSMSFNQIFRNEIIAVPKLKIINCHAGKLPFYRGRNVLNWALINDESEFGITVHFVNEGIDTGDIILQRTFPINDADTYKTLLDVAYEECSNILYDAIVLFIEGTVSRVDQKTIHTVGMYCGMRRAGDEVIDWNQSSREVFNFVRAICSPGPQARTYLDGAEVKIEKVRIVKDAPRYKGIPGQILSKSNQGNFYIKTQDSFIEVVEYTGKLKVGGRLVN